MDKYQLIKDIINLIDDVDFEKRKIKTVKDLIVALNSDIRIEDEKQLQLLTINPRMNVNDEIGRYITRMNRFASIYAKDILKDLPYVSLNDFGFVAILHSKQKLTKTELIKLMLMDKSPGMEIIKRLVSKNIMEEFENENDKRSKMIRLTNYGIKVVFKSYSEMSGLSDKICADLDESTKFDILKTLKYLDDFHQDKVGNLL